MDYEKAVNMAVGCVMNSYLDMDKKTEVIETLRNLEEKFNQSQAMSEEVEYADDCFDIDEE